MSPNRLWRRYDRLLGTDVSSDVREELGFHIESKVDELVGQGWTDDEARREAERQFGSLCTLQREGERIGDSIERRNRRRECWIGVSQDFRYALRVLGKSPGFALAVFTTLAFGIGANLTVFLVLYGVLLRPLPFPKPQQLVRIERTYADGTIMQSYSGTKALFFDRMNRSFSSMAAYDYIPAHASLLQGNDAVSISVLRVTSGFFDTFDLQPTMGRGFTAGDMVPNAAGVIVLSNALWRHQFGGDPNILGKSVNLGNRTYTVIGVSNPRFALDAKADAWIPLPIAEGSKDQTNFYNIVGRMKPGVTRAAATADLARVLLELKNVYPDLWDRQERVQAVDLHDSFTGKMQPALRILMIAVGLVLVVVAANILSLLLTRAVARRRDLGVHVALGASGWRMMRQLLAENAVLSILGGIGGIVVAKAAVPVLMHFSPIDLPQFASLGIGGAVVALAIALTVLCAILFSVVPALETRPSRIHGSLQLNSTRIAHGRNLAQKTLVVSEVAVSLVLLVGAILLLTTFWKLVHTPPGFATRNILTFKNNFTDQQAATSAALGQRLNELKSQIDAVPGVKSAAAAITLPTQLTPGMPFSIIGRSPDRSDSGGGGDYIAITAGLFRTLGVPLMAGRDFTDSDTPSSDSVLIVNQEFVRRYFPNENPVGQHLLIGKMMGPGFEDQIREIVGVVGDVKQDGLDQPVPTIMYLPATQVPDRLTQMDVGLLGESWVVRTDNGKVGVLPSIRRIFIRSAHTSLLSVEPMSQVIDASVAQQRFNMILLCGFGLISLILGAAGLYGVMSYTVARQTREIGVRMALGAVRGDIARMVLRDAGLLVGMGLIIGVASALAGARILSSILFGITPRDPLTLPMASGVLLMTGLFAAWWPARRAARVEPMEALRNE